MLFEPKISRFASPARQSGESTQAINIVPAASSTCLRPTSPISVSTASTSTNASSTASPTPGSPLHADSGADLAAGAGRPDVAGQAQTGTGKTAAFLVAAMQRLLTHRPPVSQSPKQPAAEAAGVRTGLDCAARLGAASEPPSHPNRQPAPALMPGHVSRASSSSHRHVSWRCRFIGMPN
jgi:hypothetical protein